MLVKVSAIPGTDKYEKLSPIDKFDAVTNLLAREESGLSPNFDVIVKLSEEREYQRLEAAKSSPIWDIAHHFKVRNKPGIYGDSAVIMPVRPVGNQLELLKYIEECYLASRPAWVICPKSRQALLTTAAVWAGTWHLTRHEGIYGIVVSHDEPTALQSFSQYEFTTKTDFLAPVRRISNRRELIFENPDDPENSLGSRMFCRVASDNTGIAHGYPWTYVHINEMGFIDPELSYSLIQGILDPMPKSGFSMVIAEGRGGVPAGWAYDICMQEVKHPGSTGFKLLFFSAKNRPDASKPFDSEYEKLKFADTMNEDERAMRAEFGVSLEWLNWRRQEYRTTYAKISDERRRDREFQQNNPLTILQAFQAEDEQVFDPILLTRYFSKSQEPPARYDIRIPKSSYLNGHIDGHVTPKPILVPLDGGELHVWEEPQPGHEYCFGCDPALGGPMGDNSAMVGGCRTCRKLAFIYRAKVRPLVFQDYSRMVSKFWNDAILNMETNFRAELIDNLTATDRCRFLYFRDSPVLGRVMDGSPQKYGFTTTGGTKRQLIHIIQEKMETEPGFFISREILSELQTYAGEVKNGNLKYVGARGRGQHDDLVIALGLMFWADHDMPRKPKSILEELPTGKSVGEQWQDMIARKQREAEGHASEWDIYGDQM